MDLSLFKMKLYEKLGCLDSGKIIRLEKKIYKSF